MSGFDIATSQINESLIQMTTQNIRICKGIRIIQNWISIFRLEATSSGAISFTPVALFVLHTPLQN